MSRGRAEGGPYPLRFHVWGWGEGDSGRDRPGVGLYSKVQCIMGSGHM